MKALILPLLLFISQLTHAAVQYDIEEPGIVARMNDLTLSDTVIEMFWNSYNHPSRPISPPQAMQRIIDEALLAQYARETLPTEILNTENKVGFLLAVQRQDRTIALIRKFNEKALYSAVKGLPGGALDGIYTFNNEITAQKYKDLFSLKSKVNIEATPDQIKTAKETVVATVTLSGKSVPLTLFDIYERQNVQGRLAMHDSNVEHLKSEIKQRVGSLFVLYWATKNLNEQDLSAIKQIILNEQHKTTLLQNMGLYADVHDDNPALRKRAQNISEKEVLKFYNDHKDEFAVVEKVKARHLQVTDQAEADRIHQEIKDGLAFKDAVLKYSVAKDKNNKEPGSLGWLERKDKKRSWLHSVAFTHKEGQVSVPFRSPQNQGDIVFEIVFVDERVDGYLTIDDPTVRYEASRDIALKQLKQEFITLQQSLRSKANIHLNKKAFSKKPLKNNN